MNYESLKKLLTSPDSTIWIQGKKVDSVSGADVWEYEFGGLGMPRVVGRGVDTNNMQLKFASSGYGIFVDGKKLNLEPAQYADLFAQMGYVYSVVQPQKLKQQSQTDKK